jgi:hypothetical protein
VAESVESLRFRVSLVDDQLRALLGRRGELHRDIGQALREVGGEPEPPSYATVEGLAAAGPGAWRPWDLARVWWAVEGGCHAIVAEACGREPTPVTTRLRR